MFEITHQYPLGKLGSKVKLAYPRQIITTTTTKNNTNSKKIASCGVVNDQDEEEEEEPTIQNSNRRGEETEGGSGRGAQKAEPTFLEQELSSFYDDPCLMRLLECKRAPKKKTQLQIAPTTESSVDGAIPV